MEFSRRRFAAIGLVVVAGMTAVALLVRRPATAARPAPAAALPGTGLQVEVLNGSGRRGLARAATRVLREAGFDVVFFGTAPDSVPGTLALARRGDSLAAVRVARALGSSRARVALDTLRRVDVTVLLGKDFEPPPGLRP